MWSKCLRPCVLWLGAVLEEVTVLKFSAFKSILLISPCLPVYFCVLRSHSNSVEASGSRWILKWVLHRWLSFFPPWCSLMTPAAVLFSSFAGFGCAGVGWLAGRVLTQRLGAGSPFAISCTFESQRGVLIQLQRHCRVLN